MQRGLRSARRWRSSSRPPHCRIDQRVGVALEEPVPNPAATLLARGLADGLEGGTVRAIAVTTKERSPALPDVPTVAEQGVPGFDTAVWWASSDRRAWTRRW